MCQRLADLLHLIDTKAHEQFHPDCYDWLRQEALSYDNYYMTLAACRVQSFSLYMYKALNSLAPPYLSSFFTHVTDMPSRRRLSLGVHQPAAGAVLSMVNNQKEGVHDRWRACLEQSSL